MRMTRCRPVSTCFGWPNGGKLRRPVCEFEFNQDENSTLVITSPCKSKGFKGLCTSRLLCSKHSAIMD